MTTDATRLCIVSRSDDYEEFYLLRYNAVCSARSQLTFRRYVSLGLSPFFTLVSFLVYSSTLKMEATCSSEMSVDFKRTTRRYISEDKTLEDFLQSRYSKLEHLRSGGSRRSSGIKATDSSETSLSTHQTARRHNPEVLPILPPGASSAVTVCPPLRSLWGTRPSRGAHKLKHRGPPSDLQGTRRDAGQVSSSNKQIPWS
jgi:hypothetical protein